jgi:hypothetical protein
MQLFSLAESSMIGQSACGSGACCRRFICALRRSCRISNCSLMPRDHDPAACNETRAWTARKQWRLMSLAKAIPNRESNPGLSRERRIS